MSYLYPTLQARLTASVYFVFGSLWLLPSESVQAQNALNNRLHAFGSSQDIDMPEPVDIVTETGSIHGVYAQSGGRITLNGGSVTTKGRQAN